MEYKILIVDDEREIADLLEMYLLNEDYTVFKYYTAEAALTDIESTEFDLAILDIMLPNINGFSICQKIREKYTYPIIMLTAKDSEIDKITGLTIGADDYVTKPFKPLELLARVKAQLRRYKKYGNAPDTPIYEKEEKKEGIITTRSGLVLNINAHECIINNKIISLTPTEWKILLTLCERKGNVVSSEALFRAVWGNEYYDKNSNTITVHVRHLRDKLGDTIENPHHIKTVWGVGYKIEN